jgi:ubiquinone/menaquinone biosynthesis C-methylase UbiE
MMNWHETISLIREDPIYSYLVKKTYLEQDLCSNIKIFSTSEEFKETLDVLKKFNPQGTTLLDVGAGNGISAINFAFNGYQVSAVEPDESDSVGSKAIEFLIQHYRLKNLGVFNAYAENMPFENGTFDIVYSRQALHHASNLKDFLKECARLLKPGGILFTVRDHVIKNDLDKQIFLNSHPLHKYYGGENAFTITEYETAFAEAGLHQILKLGHYESVINYYPMTIDEFNNYPAEVISNFKKKLSSKIGKFSRLPGFTMLYKIKNGLFSTKDYLKEDNVSGKLYSFVYQKAYE